MNPKEVVHNTAYSVQLPYIASLPLKINDCCFTVAKEYQWFMIKNR